MGNNILLNESGGKCWILTPGTQSRTYSGVFGPGVGAIDIYDRNHDYPAAGQWPPLLGLNPDRSVDLPYDYEYLYGPWNMCEGASGGAGE